MRALTVARLLGARIDGHLVEIQSLLLGLSKIVSADPADTESNDALLAAIRAELPEYYSNLNIADLDGRNIGTSLQPVGDRRRIFVGDRAYFQTARGDRKFVIGEPVRSRTSNAWAISFARPVLNADGRVGAIVVASALLERITALLDPGAFRRAPSSRCSTKAERSLRARSRRSCGSARTSARSPASPTRCAGAPARI